MLTKTDVHNVMDGLLWSHLIIPNLAQVIESLRVYVGRGEYDGTFNSAVNCLLAAQYEIEGCTNDK